MIEPDKLKLLGALVDAACEGRITDQEVRQLESLLTNDPECQQFYLKRRRLHAALRWDQRGAAEWNALKQLKGGADVRCDSLSGQSSASRRRVAGDLPSRPFRKPYAVRWIAAAVASAAASIALAWLWTHGPDERERPLAATVSLAKVAFANDATANFHAAGVESAGDAAVISGESLGRGQLRLNRGVMRLDFANGATVTLESPAELTLLSPSRARLDRGRLTAKAPPEAIGFAIDTPSLNVVDLGTVFGVATDETGAAEVLVFDGHVQLASAAPTSLAQGATPQRLNEGDAARSNFAGGPIEQIKFDGRQFSRSWPVTYGVLAATGVVKFVEPAPFIVPRLYEDTEHLIIFPEREAVLLEEELTVTVAQPGSYAGPYEPSSATVAAGKRVRTYLLQFNPLGRKAGPVRRMEGSATFDRPILGLICTNKQLVATDAMLGAEKFESYPRGGRGVEEGDAFVLSEDRRTLSVILTAAPAMDQIRLVLDAASDPAATTAAILP